MSPKEIATTLVNLSEEQGLVLLQTQLPLLPEGALDRLVYYLKREADRGWNTNVALSLHCSTYLLFIGDYTKHTFYHAIGLMVRGDALRRMDQDYEALPYFDAAGEEFLALHDELSWARTRIGRVSSCLKLNRTTEALHDAEMAHDIFLRHGKLLRAGQIDVNAAIIHYELGQYDQALRLFDRAIETYLMHSDHVELHIARARGNKALTLAALGKFREAIALHEQVRATFLGFGEKEEISVARVELNIADIYAAQGHYSQALSLYHTSRSIFHSHQMGAAAAEVAQQMCDCLVCLNRLQEAYDLVAGTIDYFRSVPGQQHNLARSLIQQATAAMLLRSFQEAEEMLKEASALLEAGGFVRLAALCRLRRAELYFANAQSAESMREAEYVADIFAEQEDLPHLAQTMLLLGRIADGQGDVTTAYELCNQALDVARGQELLDLQYRCYDSLGQLAERQGDIETAESYYDQAVQGIDEVQSRLVVNERTSFLEDKAAIYQRAIVLAYKRGRLEQALLYVEKAKSRILSDYLRTNVDVRILPKDMSGGPLFEELNMLREEHAWFSAIVYHTDEREIGTDTGALRLPTLDVALARQEMQKREHRIEQLIEQIHLRHAGELELAVRSRRGFSGRDGYAPWLQLPADTLLLEYYFAGQDMYIFQVTHAGIVGHLVSDGRSQIERLMSLWRTNLDVAGQLAGDVRQNQLFVGLQKNSLGLLQRLYQLLLQPVAEALTHAAHLIVVPYGVLHYLPFHSLFDGTSFVIEKTYVSYLPTGDVLDICKQRGERIRQRELSLEQSLVLGLSEGGRLTYAQQEAESVAQQLGAICALNEHATTELLEKMGANSPIIHIAAHGLFRLDAPDFSYIQLFDRQFSTIEAFNLRLSRCSLVVLSACETGRAAIGGVDEVMGLGRGFLYAGAASLLPTLWKVDDASSAELMQMFYQALLSGVNKAAALAYAQRTFLARVRTSERADRVHPYFWAAFQLIGDAGAL
jgi:CHAT domain-containing protein/tetratricopeptide (TPR) repeat protein